jgi:DNA-binding NarL/FixJ family response regulator
MNDSKNESLPWPRINEYVLSLSSASSKQELLQLAVDGIGGIIPFDSSCGIFDMERRHIYGVGLSEKANRSYNEYYRFIQIPYALSDGPAFPDPAFFQMRIHTFSAYANSEYYADFARPNGLEYAVAALLPWGRIVMNPIRSRHSRVFSEQDDQICGIATAHLNNLYAIFDKLSASAACPPSTEEIRSRFSVLSRREAEIGHFLCFGLTAPEIASRLFLSERTVEAHMAKIYAKLDVRTKRAAIALLACSEGERS